MATDHITKVTVSGGFHNSADISLRIKGEKISAGQYKRLTNHMCGIKDCICGPRHGWEINGMQRGAFLEMLEEANYASSL